MAAENTRDLLDELNINKLQMAIESNDPKLLNNFLEGYKVQVEEDKIYLQNDREQRNIDVTKELKELELEVKKAEIEQRREQFILENEARKEELEIRKSQILNEELRKQQEHFYQVDMLKVKEEENRLKKEEIKANKTKTWIDCVIKGGALVGGIVLTGMAIYVGNEGVLNKSVFEIAQSLVFRKV